VLSQKRKKNLRIIVAGGAGYIGSIATALLLKEGWEVIIIDNLVKGHREALPLHPSARFINTDINDRKTIEDICVTGIDIVMHFASFIEVGESVKNPLKYYTNNVSKTIAFLETLIQVGVKNIIFSSSAAVYGIPEKLPITEDSPLRPVNPYGRGKMMIEEIIQDFASAFGLNYVILRYFNAAGAMENLGEDHDPETHLIPRILECAIKNTPVSIYGIDYPTRDGSCIRDYVHVYDIAQAHLLSAQYLMDEGASEIFNLGTETGHTVLEVLEVAEKVTGKKIQRSIQPRRQGDPPALVASSKKAKDILGWTRNPISLEEIIKSAWEWKKKFPDGYRKAQEKGIAEKK